MFLQKKSYLWKEKSSSTAGNQNKKTSTSCHFERFYFSIFYSKFFYTHLSSVLIFRKISKSFATIFSLLFFFFFRKISILFVTIFLLFSFFFFRKILIPSFFYNIQTTNLSTFFISEKISFI